MFCRHCKTEIKEISIIFVEEYFCNALCQLTFWKNELPNLGGSFILENDLSKMVSMSLENREREYHRIVNYIHKNFQRTPLIDLLNKN
jgi:hypothetical protein